MSAGARVVSQFEFSTRVSGRFVRKKRKLGSLENNEAPHTRRGFVTNSLSVDRSWLVIAFGAVCPNLRRGSRVLKPDDRDTRLI